MSEANVVKRKVKEYQKLFEQEYCFYSLNECEKPDTGDLHLVHYDETTREEFKRFCETHEKPIRDKDLNRFKDNSSYWALLTDDDKIASWGWLAYRQPFYIKEMDTEIDMGDAGTAILYDFHTSEDYRGRGYYGILLRSIVHESEGPTKYLIYARRNNPASCRGIEKAGFHYEGEYSQAGGQMDEYLLTNGFAVITHPHEPLKPELSVIIPVYNASKYIEETLRSILTQSLAHLEVICVDDGSTDDSREIISRIAEDDPRLRLITQENQFAGIARNNGLLHARGEYIHFMDADDTVLPYAYHCVLAKAKKYDLDVLRFGGIAIEEGTGRTREGYSMDGTGFADFMRLLDPEKDDVLFQISVTPWTGIYKRTFLTENKIEFNGLRVCNDRSFYLRCITLAKRIMVSSDKVVLHKVEVSTSLVSSRAKYYDCQQESTRIIVENMKKDGVSDEVFRRVMEFEFLSYLFWYRRIGNDPGYGDKVRKITEEVIAEYLPQYPYLQGLSDRIHDALDGKTGEMPVTYRDYFFEASENPVMSFLVSVRNHEDVLNRTLDSLTRQSVRDWELFVIAEGTSDSSLKIVREYSSIDKRITIVRRVDPEELKGEYVSLIEAGDILFYDTLEKKEVRTTDGILRDMMPRKDFRSMESFLRKEKKQGFFARLLRRK